ncbi:hypothetical protein VP1G_01026 [Cytospora mali]|uniref:Band 7 domain-containing protein n=1 Tax=Cytospora mali TaxID=578113 RepID=A0A194UPP5_CYTMA|nr:hypothetical protein VP1G_01026 [Valsa mali var. pyri (nom. inval.)]
MSMVSMQKALVPALRQGLALQSAATLSARALSSTAARSLTNSKKLPVPSSTRSFSQSTSHGAPNSSLLGISGAGGSGLPTSYFQKPSLPANTVVRFVPQQTAWLVERMGKFNRILEPGLAILIPFIDRIAYVKSLKEIAIEIPSQSAITADNVTLELDGVLYTRVFDAYKASYGVEDAEYAISQLAQTTMRSEIGQLTLDHVLKERAALNTNITVAINEAAEAWGVTCLRYEIRDIHAPAAVVEAMHRQVTAERSKRAEILDSEGQRQSAINIAEGKKQSVILASEAMRAEKINRASGESEAILLKARATAAGIEAVAKSIAEGQDAAQNAVSLSVAEKYVDAFGKLAKEGTAVVVPGNVGDIGSMIATALSVYGKVGDAQGKSLAKNVLDKDRVIEADGNTADVVPEDEVMSSGNTSEKDSIVADFDKAAAARK